MGFEVDVFEALHEVGGVLKYGIPEFRLPNSVVDAELDALRAIGVRFHTDIIIGKTITYDELQRRGYRGIFVASRALAFRASWACRAELLRHAVEQRVPHLHPHQPRGRRP